MPSTDRVTRSAGKTGEIVLVYPITGRFQEVFAPWVPLSILAAANLVHHAGVPVTLIDFRHDPARAAREFTAALSRKPRIVGVSAMTGYQLIGALELIAQTRAQSPDTRIIWGGVHASIFPEQVLREAGVDAVIAGEGEIPLQRLHEAYESGARVVDDIPGVWCLDEGENVVGQAAVAGPELDDLPILPYDLLDIKRYRHRYFGVDNVLEIETSRGCPYACKYCYQQVTFKQRWRGMSPERMVDEIALLVDRYGAKGIWLIDDSFFVQVRRARAFFELILKRDVKVELGFQGANIQHLCKMSDEDLKLMHRAGTRYIQFGVESGDDGVLDLVDKRLKVEQVMRTNARLAKLDGLTPYYNLMFGLPGETRNARFNTAKLASSLLRDNRQAMISPFHFYTHYPGTDLYEEALRRGYKTPTTLRGWGHHDWTVRGAEEVPALEVSEMRRMEMVSVFADAKVDWHMASPVWRRLSRAYRPVARWRLREGRYEFMPEYWAYRAYPPNWGEESWLGKAAAALRTKLRPPQANAFT